MWPLAVVGGTWIWGTWTSRAKGNPWDAKAGSWWWGENSVWGRWLKGEAESRKTTVQKLTPLLVFLVTGYIIIAKWKPR